VGRGGGRVDLPVADLHRHGIGVRVGVGVHADDAQAAAAVDNDGARRTGAIAPIDRGDERGSRAEWVCVGKRCHRPIERGPRRCPEVHACRRQRGLTGLLARLQPLPACPAGEAVWTTRRLKILTARCLLKFPGPIYEFSPHASHDLKDAKERNSHYVADLAIRVAMLDPQGQNIQFNPVEHFLER
jgi:hypothetical protein